MTERTGDEAREGGEGWTRDEGRDMYSRGGKRGERVRGRVERTKKGDCCGEKQGDGSAISTSLVAVKTAAFYPAGSS